MVDGFDIDAIFSVGTNAASTSLRVGVEVVSRGLDVGFSLTFSLVGEFDDWIVGESDGNMFFNKDGFILGMVEAALECLILGDAERPLLFTRFEGLFDDLMVGENEGLILSTGDGPRVSLLEGMLERFKLGYDEGVDLDISKVGAEVIGRDEGSEEISGVEVNLLDGRALPTWLGRTVLLRLGELDGDEDEIDVGVVEGNKVGLVLTVGLDDGDIVLVGVKLILGLFEGDSDLVFVGDIVGPNEGDVVGTFDKVGMDEGDIVGLRVGARVGDLDGNAVGRFEIVGVEEGDFVGLRVGVFDGNADGDTVLDGVELILGLLDGDFDLVFVGDIVGLRVGDLDGNSVGRFEIVGVKEGDIVGLRVGDFDGIAVGIFVIVGKVDGNEEGILDGRSVGVFVGGIEGTRVGCVESAIVGPGEGFRVTVGHCEGVPDGATGGRRVVTGDEVDGTGAENNIKY